LARYYNHIASFSEAARSAFPGGLGAPAGGKAKAAAPAPAAKKAAAPAPAADDDGAALFGDDDDEATSAKVAAAAKSAKKEEAPKKKEKAPVIAKTSCIYEVKPIEAGQDMKALEGKIRSITMDGLLWGGEFKVVDVAFGIQKLIVQCIVEDEKVALDELEEKMTAFTEDVSSIDQIAMNKVG
jgi:elongation factor 1-beta